MAGAVTVRLFALAALLLASASGCAPPAAMNAEPPRYAPEDQATTRAAKSTGRPLVLEWPAADRAALEAQRAKGIVVVRYAQHEMEVLRGCRAAASYRYASITPKEEGLVFRTTDELDAAMPVHAVRLEAKLRERKALSVAMTIVGMYESDARAWKAADLSGDCAGATHVVRALAVGAFEISASARSSAGASARGLGAGIEARHDDEREVLHRDGTASACARASLGDAAPPYDCGAPLRVEVASILYAKAPARACDAGFVAKDDACVAASPDRPALLDVLTPKK